MKGGVCEVCIQSQIVRALVCHIETYGLVAALVHDITIARMEPDLRPAAYHACI
jgi:hypothetical protein